MGTRRYVDRIFHSSGWKFGRDWQQSDIQQAGGDQSQPNHQPQLQEWDSGKNSSKAQQPASAFVPTPLGLFSPFTKTSRGALKAITTAKVVNGILTPVSGRINIVASFTSLVPPGRDPVLSSGESQTSSTTLTQPPPHNTGLDGGGDISLHVHCTSNPQTPGSVSTPATTSPSSVPPAISSHLRQRILDVVQESLTKYELPSLELDSFQSQSAAQIVQSLITELETAHRENKDRQWQYKDRQGNEIVGVEHLGNILRGMEKYAKIVDTTIQHHPDITSLVWANARNILQGKQLTDICQVALHQVEAMECFEGTIMTIMDKMAVSAFYEGIYMIVGLDTAMGDTGKLYEALDMALPELYAAVIVFASKARQYFNSRCKLAVHRMLKRYYLGDKNAVNMPKPFAVEFQPFIDDISRKEKTVQECADMATMDRIRDGRESSETITVMENLLRDMRADMEPLLQLNEWRSEGKERKKTELTHRGI
ncbi:hypothetical protein L211DRAFT_848057 [Terfezia boudieri ATCC MYA-4762]|uniref:NWD NACHT-NTPase N-terminal domain-containing protein n=1 Tax=Terfezia boudieri ATCC MYA-4762 TaxID=1051890 RepID=A0A3N4M4D7_9PEZI|nr:hypothetical protein L211DRAFT_848057 [Terfezia boudieri ATCC MYA-4762]